MNAARIAALYREQERIARELAEEFEADGAEPAAPPPPKSKPRRKRQPPTLVRPAGESDPLAAALARRQLHARGFRPA